jgi:hypothetical protein
MNSVCLKKGEEEEVLAGAETKILWRSPEALSNALDSGAERSITSTCGSRV